MEAGAALTRTTYRRLDLVGWLANGLGGVAVFSFVAFLLPRTVGDADYETLLLRSGVVFVVVVAFTIPIGRRLTSRRYFELTDWLSEGSAATYEQRRGVLRYPLYFAQVSAFFWIFDGAILTVVNGTVSGASALGIALAALFGGAMACALEYLLVERIMRPVAARALGPDAPPKVDTPGVAARLTMAWTLATGVPLLGVLVLVVIGLTGGDLDTDQILAASLFLVLLALGVGLGATLLASRSVADPVTAVGGALKRVEQGDYAVEVPVDDGSEVGLLQAGFNRMAAGLAERERLRDLFGRHVGEDVARAALEEEVHLGGEVREVGVMFMDVVGSTTMAARRPPTEVVELLNAFFAVVYEATTENGGLINKFEGDAALCIFGAPTRRDDPAGDALAAARTLRDRLRADLPEVDVGIGVSFGPAVAGNVGAEERFEYTVIGDPVNEGARLCELAKEREERVLASERAIEAAREEEAVRWKLGDGVTLRGRDEETRLATA